MNRYWKIIKRKSISLIRKFLILTIIYFGILIVNKMEPSIGKNFKSIMFNKSLNFGKINTISKKIIGKSLLYDFEKKQDELVFSEDIVTGEAEKFFNGEKYYLKNKEPVGAINSGVVVFLGNKDHFGNTIVVQGTDGFNIWYGNIDNVNVGLYTYVEKGMVLGNILSDEIYLLIEKDNHIYTYEEYKKNKS